MHAPLLLNIHKNRTFVCYVYKISINFYIKQKVTMLFIQFFSLHECLQKLMKLSFCFHGGT